MKGILLWLTVLSILPPASDTSWQMAEYPSTAQVLKLLNGKTAPQEFRIATRETSAGKVSFQVFYQAGIQSSASTLWQVRKVVTVAEALDFVNLQGAFANTPEKEFRICGVANEKQSPSFWIFYREYEGRTPEAAKGEWNWKEKTYDRAAEVLSFLNRRRSEELLTDVEITGTDDKFHVFYRAPHLYDAPGMPTPVWNWLKCETAASLLDVLKAGTDRENRPIHHPRIAPIHQSSGSAFYLFY